MCVAQSVVPSARFHPLASASERRQHYSAHMSGSWQAELLDEDVESPMAANVWNLGDASNESMAGGIGWYRKDFELPSADSSLAWAFRFESVNYRASVWLNGVPIGQNTGAYVPFEFDLVRVVMAPARAENLQLDNAHRPSDMW